MKQWIEFKTDAGETILVEVTALEQEYGPRAAANDSKIIAQANQTFQNALNVIKPVANAVIEKFDELTRKPDEMEAEFGLTLSADVGAVIATSGVEANIKIVLRWKSHDN